MQTEIDKKKETYVQRLGEDISDFLNTEKDSPYATYHGHLDDEYVYLLTIKKRGTE